MIRAILAVTACAAAAHAQVAACAGRHAAQAAGFLRTAAQAGDPSAAELLKKLGR